MQFSTKVSNLFKYSDAYLCISFKDGEAWDFSYIPPECLTAMIGKLETIKTELLLDKHDQELING